MNWVDGAIVAALLLGLWRGASKGFGQAGGQWAGAVAGVLGAYLWGQDVAHLLTQRGLLPDWLARPVATVGLALAIAGAGALAGQWWGRWARNSSWGRWDRWAGACLGCALAAFICAALLLVWVEWPGRPFPAAVEDSLLARKLLTVLPSVYRRVEWVLAPLRS